MSEPTPGRSFSPGDWVQVFGQVAAAERVHPDDVVVELFSHSDQYVAVVRRDRVVHIAPPEGIATRCTALYVVPKQPNDALLRCHKHDGHAPRHEAVAANGAPWGWIDEQTAGHMEDPS